MTLLDAKEYDPQPAQRRLRLLVAAAVVAIIVAALGYWFRFWPEEHVVNRFFEAIEAKNFEAAFGIYDADPEWKQHPGKYKDYSYNQFYLDWGTQGEYGTIASHQVECAVEPPKSGFQSASGVIVVVRINHRTDTKPLWVEKKSKTITTSPLEAVCHG